MSFRPRASAEWRNPPRWTKNQRKVKLAAWEDSSTRIRSLGMTCRYVIPFNRTGYNRNVAGGRLPPLRTHRLVIPFICTGSIQGAPGTAHRPFPTISLMGGSIHLHRLYSGRSGRQIAARTDTPVGDTVHPHGFYSGRSLRFRWLVCVLTQRISKTGTSVPSNCQL